MASIEDGSMSSRRMFSVTPSGLVPASNKNRCSRPALITVTLSISVVTTTDCGR